MQPELSRFRKESVSANGLGMIVILLSSSSSFSRPILSYSLKVEVAREPRTAVPVAFLDVDKQRLLSRSLCGSIRSERKAIFNAGW